MRGNNRPTPTGGNQISGSLVTGNVQMAGEVTGGMSMTTGGTSNDASAQLLEALRALDAALAPCNGPEAEQARTATAMIEQEVASAAPERSRIRAAHAKLQEIALSLGVIAATVNNVGAAITRFGVH